MKTASRLCPARGGDQGGGRPGKRIIAQGPPTVKVEAGVLVLIIDETVVV